LSFIVPTPSFALMSLKFTNQKTTNVKIVIERSIFTFSVFIAVQTSHVFTQNIPVCFSFSSG